MRRLNIIIASAFLTLSSLAAPSAIAQSEGFSFRPPSPSGSYLAGQEALDDLRTSDAASYLLDATQEEWENPAVIERAFAALAADGRIDEAEGMAQHMLELLPNHELAQLVIGTVALKERRYSSTISRFENLGVDNFVGITAMILQGWAHVGQGDLDLAYGVLDEMGTGLESFLIFHRALMADMQGADEAVELTAQAYAADPFLSRAVEAYSRVLGNRGEFETALNVIQDYESAGYSSLAVDQVFESLVEGIRPGKFAGSVPAGAAEAFLGIGSALARDGAPDISLVFLQLGYYLDPESDVIAMTIGNLLDVSGEHQAANSIYTSIRSDSVLKPDAEVRVAENLDSLGNRDEAIRRLNNIVQTQSQNVLAASALGNLLRMDDQLDAAIVAYSKIIDMEEGDKPRDWRYYYLRGIVYEQNDQWAEAESDLLRALDLNPSQPQVLNYLGYSWVDQGLNLTVALEMIEQAVQANPRDGYIVDSLGWAFFRLERYDEAVQVLEEAVRLLPNDPEINDHLGDAYWRIGRRLEARYQWEIGLDVDDRGDVTARVGPKLENGLPEIDV